MSSKKVIMLHHLMRKELHLGARSRWNLKSSTKGMLISVFLYIFNYSFHLTSVSCLIFFVCCHATVLHHLLHWIKIISLHSLQLKMMMKTIWVSCNHIVSVSSLVMKIKHPIHSLFYPSLSKIYYTFHFLLIHSLCWIWFLVCNRWTTPEFW